MTRLRYDNDSGKACSGLFCRMPTLSSTYNLALRFGWGDSGQPTICKFNKVSSWYETGNVLYTTSNGSILSSACGYSTGSDFYLTFVYTAYDDTNTTDYEEWIEEKRASEILSKEKSRRKNERREKLEI